MSWIHQVVQIYEYTVLLWLGTWLGKLLPGPMDSQLGNLQEQPQRVVLQANLSIWCSSDLQNPRNKGRQLHAQGRKFGWWLVFQMCSFSLNDLIWLVLISSFLYSVSLSSSITKIRPAARKPAQPARKPKNTSSVPTLERHDWVACFPKHLSIPSYCTGWWTGIPITENDCCNPHWTLC